MAACKAKTRILMLGLVLVFLNLFHLSAGILNATIRVGGLFDVQDEGLETAFRNAVERLNNNRNLPLRFRLTAQVERLPKHDSFHTSKRVCKLIQQRVVGIFGPQTTPTANHVQSICDALEIPHVETRWEGGNGGRRRDNAFSVNLYPHPSVLSKAFVDVIDSLDWKAFTILYEDNQGLVRMQELLKAPMLSDRRFSVRQLSADGDNRSLLKEIKKAGENKVVLDCKAENIHAILKQAQQVGMTTHYNSYLVTSLDMHTVSMDEFQYGGANITALRLVDPKRAEAMQHASDWMFGEMRITKNSDLAESNLKTEIALMYDAVHLFGKALHDLDRSQDIEIHPLSCDSDSTWVYGNSLINYMKLVEMEGLTGMIRFDQNGLRTNFDLDIIELSVTGINKIGMWNSVSGVNYTRSYSQAVKDLMTSLHNKMLKVTTIISRPLMMQKENHEHLTGNDKFEGYAVDLIDQIAKELNFTYQIHLVGDGKYGGKNKDTGEWNGMIKELIDQKADIAIADLSISRDREEAVDFTMPFMNLGISILFKKPTKPAPFLFSFLSPLSVDVWIYMATAYLAVSVILFILARFTPYEWQNPHPCNPDPEVLENQFSLVNCMWFTIGSLMQQGCDFLPKAVSTRLVAGMWWFFTLIMISSYTANLAAFLTVERMAPAINSIHDLVNQKKIKYGCVDGGSTKRFFADSREEVFDRAFSSMENTQPKVYTSNNAEGVERVKKGNYAFFIESTVNEYYTERECELMQIGGLLDAKGYGIATPSGSPYTAAISSTILDFQEKNKLHLLKKKWWSEMYGGGRCKDDEKVSSAASELDLANVGGVFVVLLGGMGVSCIVAVLEFIWKARKTVGDKDTGSLCMDILRELRFALFCGSSKKPIQKQLIGANGEGSVRCDNDDSSMDRRSIHSRHRMPPPPGFVIGGKDLMT